MIKSWQDKVDRILGIECYAKEISIYQGWLNVRQRKSEWVNVDRVLGKESPSRLRSIRY